jgi:DNA-binding transcriptional LysR family regulator
LGLKLFWRSSRKVELTPAGAAFLEGARRTLADADEAVRIARSVRGGETAVVTLGFVDSSVYSFMPKVLRDFRRRYPEVRVVIQALSSAQQVLALERGEIQVGILRPLRTSSRIVMEELGRESLVVALPRAHRLADHERIRIDDLRNEPFVFFKREFAPSVYDRIVGMFHRAGQMPNIVQEGGEQNTLIGLVAAGIGYSITAEGLADWGTRDVVYRPLVHPAAWVSMSIAWRKNDRSDPVSSFVASARSTAAGREPGETKAGAGLAS